MAEPSPRAHAVLVDGYNLLHAIPRFAPRGAETAPARARLEGWLAEAAARHEAREIVLVWDGRTGSEDVTPGSGYERRGRLEIVFTAPGESADDRILDLCRGRFAGRAARTWVVSSDRDVQGPANELGFGVIGAMTFFRRWSAARPRGGCAREAELQGGGKPRATRREVDELLERFLADRESLSDDRV